MIYTITLNPSIDLVVSLDHLTLGQVNRGQDDQKFPGGKGINVSRILNQLGTPSKALGFIGGLTGQFIKNSLEKESVMTDFIEVEQDSRINIKIKAQDETEINGLGPTIRLEQLEQLIEKIKEVDSNDTIVFAGSAPTNLDNSIYDRLIAIAQEKGATIVCDFEGNQLVNALKYQPLLVKPNKYELEQIYQVTFNNNKEIISYAKNMLADGAKNVIISMAGEGALFVNEEMRLYARPIQGQVINSVGAGDSMVAGFVSTWTRTHDLRKAFKMGVACGSATAFSVDLANEAFIKEIYQKVEVIEL